MHELDGPDYEAYAGTRIYQQDQPLGTLHSALDDSAVWQEVLNAVKGAGLTPATSGAQDKIAGWQQLRDAIKLLANIRTNEQIIWTVNDHAITTTPQTITPANTLQRLTGGTSGGQVHIAENDPGYGNHVILVQNDTAGPQFVGSTAAKIRMEAGSLAWFRYDASHASGSKWVPHMSPSTSDSVPEGFFNLYFTNARARAAINAIMLLTHTSITAASSVTPPTANTMLRLGGSYGPGNVDLVENDGNYADHVLFVENDGTEILNIGSSGHRVRVEPGNMVIFKYDANRSTNNKWVPIMVPNNTDSVPEGSANLYFTNGRADGRIDAALAPTSLGIEIWDGITTPLVTGLTASYRVRNNVVWLTLPDITVTTVAANLRIRGVGGIALPDAIRLDDAPGDFLIPVLGWVDDVAEGVSLRPSSLPGAYAFYRGVAAATVNPAWANPDWTGSIELVVPGQTLCFIANYVP